MENDANDKTTNVIVASAVVVSIVAAGFLLFANNAIRHEIASLRTSSAEVSLLGSLKGWHAGGNTEWVPRGRNPEVVLFQLSRSGAPSDLEFWQEVARASHIDAPDLQFAGMCTEVSNCDAAAAVRDGITLLTAMDPLQLSALSMASKDGMALVYRGSRLQSKILINDGARAVAAKLVELSKNLNDQHAVVPE
jgi:hypothetical protein